MDSQSQKGQILTEFLTWTLALSLLLGAVYQFEINLQSRINDYQFGKGKFHVKKNKRTYSK